MSRLRIHLVGKQQPILRTLSECRFINFATTTPEQVQALIDNCGTAKISLINVARIESIQTGALPTERAD